MLFEVTAIRLPPILRSDAGGQRQLEVGATTVKGALEELVVQYPSLRDRVFDTRTCAPASPKTLRPHGLRQPS